MRVKRDYPDWLPRPTRWWEDERAILIVPLIGVVLMVLAILAGQWIGFW